MNDTEIVDWIEKNMYEYYTVGYPTYTEHRLKYFNTKQADPIMVVGKSLRDCVDTANKKEVSK